MSAILLTIVATVLPLAGFYEYELMAAVRRAERAERALFRALNQSPKA